MKPPTKQVDDLKSQSHDADLVRAARRGDQKAAVEIVARHQAMVSGVTLAILGDFAAGEDAAQDAFVKAWHKLPGLREPEKLRPWLCQVARTTALDHLQKQKFTQDFSETFGDIPDRNPRPDQALVCEEERQSVLRALKSLPEKYRLPLVLYYHEEHSVRAVARALDLSENAIKKRLARGRTMMRRKMAGMIDSVLGEHLPGTTFTGSVILALGTFNPSPASAATLTTTAMSASKFSLSTMVVIAALSVPIGYSARVVTEDRTPIAEHSENARTIKNPRRESTISNKVPQSPLVIEWRELRGAYGQNSDDFTNLYQVVEGISDPLKKRAFKSVLIAEWATLDPAEGIAFFREKGRKGWELRLFLREGLKADGEGTVTSLIASGEGWQSLASRILPGIAEHAPGRLAEVASALPPRDSFWRNPVHDAFVILMRNDPEAARRAAESMTGPNCVEALGGVATGWAETDGKAAFEWAQAHEDSGVRHSVARAALIGWARNEPLAALDQIKSIPPGSRARHMSSSTGAKVLREAAKADFENTLAWVRDHRSELSHEDLDGLSGAMDQHLAANPTAFLSQLNANNTLAPTMTAIGSSLLNDTAGYQVEILSWLKTAEKNSATRELQGVILRNLSWFDPQSAMTFINDMPPGKERTKAINESAQNLFNGGQALEQLDSFLSAAGPDWQEILITNGFGYLSPEKLKDPAVWADRLEQISNQDQHESALQKLASMWAVSDPERAVAWAGSLEEESAKEIALKESVKSWAASESDFAGEWITSQASGPDRDAAVSGFVAVIGKTNPEIALQQVEGMQSPESRLDTASGILAGVAKDDPQLAGDLLENSNFPDDEKSRLRQSLNSN